MLVYTKYEDKPSAVYSFIIQDKVGHEQKIELVPLFEELIKNQKSAYYDIANRLTHNYYTSHARFPIAPKKAETIINKTNNNEILFFTVFISREGKQYGTTDHLYIGCCTLQEFNWINRSAELTIHLAQDYCIPKGIGTIITGILLNHGFTLLNLNRIWLGCDCENTAMIRVAEKNGMRREGQFAKALWNHQGKYSDMVIYGKLQNEHLQKEGD